MKRGYRLAELAERIGGRVLGDGGRRVTGVAGLADAGPDELSFLTHPRYRAAASGSRAGAVLVAPGVSLPGRDLLEAADPYFALAELLELFHPPRSVRPGVSPDARVAADARLGDGVELAPFAVIGAGAEIGERVAIGAGSVVGEECRVGDDTRLMPRVVLYPGTRLGRRCLIHAGVVLGADGFGFAARDGKQRKVPQTGRVVVGDDVEIGANSTVDRATLGETVVGDGTKVDNLVMVAHGVRLGTDCLLVAQSGVAGSARFGNGVTLAAQSGVAGHLRVGDRAAIAAKSAVFADLPEGTVAAGVPAVEHRRWKRASALWKRLPELRRELRRLGERLDRLERAGE